MQEVEKINKGSFEGKIYIDENPESPRTWDNMGKMVCFHKRYNLGDEHTLNSDSFEGWDAIEEFLIKEKKAVVILPLYLYDHSGITISTTPFNCRWDSGQIGFIYCDSDNIKKEFSLKRITKKAIKKTTDILEEEVKTYDQYLRGDIYGYVLTIKKKDFLQNAKKEIELTEEVNSCWGFYGIETVRKEIEEYIKNYEEKKITDFVTV